MAGVVTIDVDVGDAVEVGQAVATIEAMKMEAQISSPLTGVVERIAVSRVSPVEPGDLVVVVAPG